MTGPNKIWISTFAALALSASFAFSAGAQPMHRMAEKLGLTEEQQQSLAELREQQRASREDQRAQREAISEANKSGDVDSAADLAASQARDRVYQQAEMRQQLEAILTPDQLVQWDEMQDRRSQGHRGKGGKGKGGRGQRGQRDQL